LAKETALGIFFPPLPDDNRSLEGQNFSENNTIPPHAAQHSSLKSAFRFFFRVLLPRTKLWTCFCRSLSGAKLYCRSCRALARQETVPPLLPLLAWYEMVPLLLRAISRHQTVPPLLPLVVRRKAAPLFLRALVWHETAPPLFLLFVLHETEPLLLRVLVRHELAP